MNKRITVFTPTYNRAHLLERVFNSLEKQTSNDFKWLIIDDGSTDNTKEVVESFVKKSTIPIQYIYKDNGGLYTGYNAAIEVLDTELSVCIDSDDWMPDDAIEKIILHWDKYKTPNSAGLIGLDVTEDGKIIGDYLTTGEVINPILLLASKHNRGDKKYVVRTDCYKKVAPMPVFPQERNFNPHYLILKMCSEYNFIGVNEPFCIVDYQVDGMTANQYMQYIDSPNAYAELRRVIMASKGVPLKYLIKTTIHYCSSNQIAGNKKYIYNSPKPFLTIILAPLGIVLTKYINKRSKTERNK